MQGHLTKTLDHGMSLGSTEARKTSQRTLSYSAIIFPTHGRTLTKEVKGDELVVFLSIFNG
jgi:hypothetical protein